MIKGTYVICFANGNELTLNDANCDSQHAMTTFEQIRKVASLFPNAPGYLPVHLVRRVEIFGSFGSIFGSVGSYEVTVI
ncbi:MAG: hypothetical protein HYW77_00315 [Parcubacteria group bacterium]|nr:hypothetical protein [Parcubacteria group bacterium]